MDSFYPSVDCILHHFANIFEEPVNELFIMLQEENKAFVVEVLGGLEVSDDEGEIKQ